MKLSSHYAFFRSSSKAVVAIISILSIFLSLFQPVFVVQAAAPLDQKAGLDTAISLAPTGPDAPDWPPIFTKKFNPNPIYVGEISTLTFTIVNEVWMNLTGAAFTDPLPAGVQVAADPAASTTCIDAVFNPTPGATVLSFYGTLPGRGSCTAQVNVTSSVPGQHFNITSELTTDTGLIGAPASDTLIVLPRKADLAVTKTDGVDQVNAGEVTTYTVRVTNNGPDTVTGAILVDTAGPGLELTAVACSTAVGNQCVTSPLLAELTGAGISLPTLTSGQFYEIRLTASVTATSGTVTNTATVTPPKNIIDTNLDNNVATDTDIVISTPKADLAVTKTDGVDQVNAGGVTTYTVRITNNGPNTATGAILIDIAGIGLVPTAVACSTAVGNQCVTAPLLADLTSTGISLPTLTSGQFYEIRLTASVTATSGTVTNTATVLPPKDTIDPDLENNVASDTDTVVGELVADLEVTKTDGVDIILTGEITTYTVRVTNKGPATVIGANLYDTTDSGLTLLDVVCSTVAGNKCVTKPDLALMMTDGIILPTLAPGQFYEVKLIARAADFSCITTNSAIVTPPENIPDPDLSNNTAEDTNEVIPPPQANLAVTKTDGVTFVNANSVTTYTIRVTNIGPDPVTGATLIDSAGIGLSLTGVTCSTAVGNQCVTPPQLTDLTSTGAILPLLTAGQFYEIRLTANITALSGSVINTTTVTPPKGTADPNTDNNYASDTNVVIAVGTLPSDLAVTKTDGVTTVAPNGSTTYTVRVTNNGPNPVTGAKLVDNIGTGLTPTALACSTTSGNQCVTPPLLADLISSGISLPILTSGQFYEIRLTANITVASGSVTNTATVTPPASITDINPDNNTASDINTITTTPQNDLSVTKTNGVETVVAGSVTKYTVRVTNYGITALTGANLVDSAGAGLELTAVACSSASGNRCVTAPILADLTSTGVSLPTLASGQFYEIELTASVTATSGSVTNTATVTPPAGTTDTNLSNNSASDTDTLIQLQYRYYLPLVVSEPALPPIRNWNGMLGYEDLSLVTGQNDFDYNDWAVALNGSFTFTSETSNLLESFTLVFDPRTRGATYDHSFMIYFPAQTFTTNGTVVINLYDGAQNLISKKVETFTSNTDNTYVIFTKTSDVFPGSVVNTIEGNPTGLPQRYADFSITFDTPTVFNFDPNALFQPHGQNLFFDPILLVLNISEYIHQGDVRLLSIPFSDYRWPEEGVRIDRAYPLVSYIPITPPDFSFPDSWWTVFNNCVYDGVPCGTP